MEGIKYDQKSGGAKSLVQTPFFTCFGKFGMGVYPIQYTIPSSQYVWSNNHWSLAGCDGKLGFIRGIRGFGIYARAHERRCAPQAAQAGEVLGWTALCKGLSLVVDQLLIRLEFYVPKHWVARNASHDVQELWANIQ